MMYFEWKEIGSRVDVTEFDCGDKELNDFLKFEAVTYKEESFSNTIVIFDKDDTILGYVTTCTDSIRLNEKEKRAASKDRFSLSEFPSIKVARLAVAKQKQGHGHGRALLYWTINRVKEHATALGARFVTVDALPDSVGFYKKHLFIENRHARHTKPNRKSVSMRLDMHRI